MATGTTKLTNMINPEVMADMISAKIDKALVVTPFAKIDMTLAGQPGNTITVPRYDYIGDASDVAEAGTVSDTVLTTDSDDYVVKKAAKGVTVTDEVLLSAYGNPVGEVNSQLAKSIASKQDADGIDALLTSTHTYNGASAVISYSAIIDAIDVFEEELNTAKVLFINPKQLTTLRKDTNFISADKYPHDVIMTGEVGQIANCRIVPTKRIVKDASAGTYKCPIVKIETDERTEDELPALTIYKKRDVTVESERDTHTKTTFISADQHYVAALTNAAKVVVATFKA